MTLIHGRSSATSVARTLAKAHAIGPTQFHSTHPRRRLSSPAAVRARRRSANTLSADLIDSSTRFWGEPESSPGRRASSFRSSKTSASIAGATSNEFRRHGPRWPVETAIGLAHAVIAGLDAAAGCRRLPVIHGFLFSAVAAKYPRMPERSAIDEYARLAFRGDAACIRALGHGWRFNTQLVNRCSDDADADRQTSMREGKIARTGRLR